MPSRFANLLDVPVEQTEPNAAPAGGRFAGALQRTQALEAALDPARQAQAVLDLADRTGSPLASLEAHWPWVRAESRYLMTPAGPGDLGPGPLAGQGTKEAAGHPIGLAEQIRRMDAVDWAARVPFSPAGVLETADLLAATERLRKDAYGPKMGRTVREAEQLAAGIEGWQPPVVAQGQQQLKAGLRAMDVHRIEQYLLERQEVAERGQTFAARVFDGISYMPAWMIEFSLTGGLGKLGAETAREIGLRTLQGYAQTAAGRAVLTAAGWGGEALTRTTLGMPHRVADEILQRRIPSIAVGPNGQIRIATPAEGWATSIAKGWGAAVIESASETTGAGITQAGGWVAQKALARLPFGSRLYDGMRQAWLRLHPEEGAAAEFARQFFERAGYSNLVGEIGEEELGNILHGIAGTRQFTTDPNASYLENLAAGITQDLKLKNLAVVATTLAVPGAAQAGLARAVKLAGPSEIRNPKSQIEKGAPTDVVQEAQGPQGPVAAAAGAGVWDQALAAAEEEAGAQAAERFQGPAAFTFADYAELLADRSDRELRRLGRRLGLRISGASGETLRKFVGDALAGLLKEGSEPAGRLTAAPSGPAAAFRSVGADKGVFGQEIFRPAVPAGQGTLDLQPVPEESEGPALSEEPPPPATPAPSAPAPAPAAASREASFYTSIPVEWRAEKDLYSWGQKGLRSRGNRRIAGRKTFIWSSEFEELPTRLPRATMRALQARTQEYFKVHQRRGEDYWLFPPQVVASVRAELGEGAFARGPKPQRTPRQKLGDLVSSARWHELPDYEIGGTILAFVEQNGLTEADLPATYGRYIEAWNAYEKHIAEQESREVSGGLRAGVEETLPVDDSEAAEREAIQSEDEAGDIGDFLDGLIEGAKDFLADEGGWQKIPGTGPEPHPGSLTWKKFFARYGEALANPKTPTNEAWLQRYAGGEAERGPRGLYRDLQHEWHRQQAWKLFYELTGQARPEAGKSEMEADWPRPDAEAREANVELGAGEVRDVLREAAGQAPPADLPPAAVEGPEGTPEDRRRLGFWTWLLDRLGIRSADGFEALTTRDYRDVYKYVQLPDDIRRSFPSFEPVYQVQRARERAKQVLDRVFAEKLQAYFDLSNGERQAVDELLVAIDQSAGDPGVVTRGMGALSERQRAAVRAVRQSLDDAAEMLVARMRQLGIDEDRIAEFGGRIGNYIPHKWYGPWAVIVREKMTPGQMKEEGRRPQTLFMSAVGYTERFREARRLQERFPNAEVTVLHRTKVPYEAFQDAPAGTVARMVEMVLEQATATAERTGQAALPPGLAERLQQALSDLYKSKGFGMHFIQRAEVPGWTEDLRRPLAEYFAGFSGFLTKMEAGLAFTEAMQNVHPQRTPNLYRYASDYIRYVMGDEREFGRLKSLAYPYYLWGNVKSFMVNLSGNLTMGWPVLSKHTHWSLARLLAAGFDTATGRLDAGERAFLADLEAQGYLDAQLSQEIAARGGNALYRALTTPLRAGLSWLDIFSSAERFNRRSMAVALHRAGITDPAEAAAIVEEAHFHYGKGNRPLLARGYTSPVAVFRSYMLNQYTWIKNQVRAGALDLGRGEFRRVGADALPLLRSAVAILAVGGVPALVPLYDALRAAYARSFGGDPEDDLRAAMGATMATAAMRGLPGVVPGAPVSLTGSVALGDPVPLPDPGQTWGEAVGNFVLGVFADVPRRVNRVRQDLKMRNYGRALEDASPEALRNPLAAWRLWHEGATNRNGQPLWDFEQGRQLHLTGLEAAAKALGFQPQRLKRFYDRQNILEVLGVTRAHQKKVWAERLYLAGRQGDAAGVREVLAERTSHEQALRARGRGEMVIPQQELLAETLRLVKERQKPANLPTQANLPILLKLLQEQPREGAER